jgi:gliding motility-associated-like protein
MVLLRSILVMFCLVLLHTQASGSTTDTVGFGEKGITYQVQYTSGSTYQWFIAGGTIISGNNTPLVRVNWGQTKGLFYIGVLERNKFGCFGDTVWRKIFIADKKFPVIDGEDMICLGQTLMLSASGPDSVYRDLEYEWSTGEMTQSIVVSPNHTTIYSCIVYYNGDAVDTAFHQVTVLPYPRAGFNYTPRFPKTGDMMTFNPLVKSATRYLWKINNEVAGTSPTLRKVFDASGSYQVRLIMENELGCSDSSEQKITVNGKLDFYIPDAFSPNGDGEYDVFVVDLPSTLKDIKFNIYDRWGAMQFNTNLHHVEWDGKRDGVELMGGAYVIVLEAVNEFNERVYYDGTLSLMR